MPRACTVLSIVGSLLVIIGACIFHFVPIVLDELAKDYVTVTHGASPTYQAFQNASSITDLYYSFYVFNLTNADAVLNEGAEPVVEEIGPYTYLSMQFTDPTSVKWHPNATVEYTYASNNIFQPQLSNGLTEEDVFVTPNLGWIGALDVFHKLNMSDAVNAAAAEVNARYFMNLSLKELLWGYNNTVLQELITKDYFFFLDAFVRLMSNNPPMTANNPSAQWTGGDAAYNEPPASSSQTLTMWAGLTELVDPVLGPYWGSRYANMINGTNGNSFYTGMSKDDKYEVFVDDLYRSVLLSATRSLEYQGAEVYRYSIDQSSFVSQDINPDNAAFFVEDTGFLARPPLKAEPVWISKARFLHANMTYVKAKILPQVDVNANWENYDVAIDVEPITGQVFQAHKRYQINTRIVPGLNTPPSSNMVKTYYPIVWIDYHTALPRHETNKFVDSVVIPKKAAAAGSIAAMSLGSIMIAVAIGLVFRARFKGNVGDAAQSERVSLQGNATGSRRTINDAEEDGVAGAKRISTVKYMSV